MKGEKSLNSKIVTNSKKIRELREKNNYTQSFVADLIGYKVNSYCLIETGKKGMSLKKLIVLSKLYNVSVDELLLK